MFLTLEQERIRYFRLTGTECSDRAAGYSYLRNVITEIVEEGRDRDAGGSVRAVGEVVRRYVEKVKRAGCELLPTRMGMEDVFINSYHNLKFEGIPVLGQGTFFIF